jgi:diguanylate cyclase (GGDEF)-like protein
LLLGLLKHVVPLSARRLTGSYISALLIIAGLTIMSHLALAYVLHHNKGSAAIINVSGRQRMLSQRIASLAAEYRLGDSSARPELMSAINEFQTTETTLSSTNLASLSTDQETSLVRQIYLGGRPSLNDYSKGFVADARTVASLPPGDPAAASALSRVFAAARSPLLIKLNDVVQIHQHSADVVFAELEKIQLVTLVFVLLTLAVEALTIFRPMITWIIRYTGEVVRLATIDPLTEIANRRGFIERFEIERARAARSRRPLSLLMFDVDHFKNVNDTYGHDGGDAVLRAMADCFRQAMRASDVAGRLGGEEFVILLPETDLSGAQLLAERLRAAIERLALSFGKHLIGVTVSIGVVSVQHDEGAVERALHEADALMYRAKRLGRNCVVSEPPAYPG